MKWSILGKIVGSLVVVGMVFVISAPHRMERVMTFMQGDSNTSSVDENSYHIAQARIAIGSGGLFGLGIGKSVQSTGYLPEAINDSIFAIMGETFGFVGLLAILVLFSMLLLSLLRVASRLPDMGLRLLVVGVFGWVGSHVILNVAAMTGVAPLTGIPLPLLSYGGTSMLFIAAALGLAFQLSRYTSHKPIEEGVLNGQDSRSRRRLGRTRYASRGSV
jgi:cell division protein FtsW